MTNDERSTNDEQGENVESSADVASHLRPCEESPLIGYLQLMRLPNVFTAMGDVAMGFLFVQSTGWRWDGWRDGWTLGLLVVASTALYTAGMVLNDVFDLRTDWFLRPERPIPSGRVSLRAARRLGWNLLMLGVTLGIGAAFFAGHHRPGVVAALLAANVVLYDAWLKRTPGGPLAMGSCRTLNVLLGMSVMNSPLASEHWLVAGAIGVYVAGVTWFARREAGQSRRLPLTLATLVMILGIAMLAWLPRCSEPDRLVRLLQVEPLRWYLLTGGVGALIVWRCIRAVIEPTSRRVRMAVAHCLLSLLMLDAVACYAVRGVFWAMLIMLLLIPTFLLQRRIAMT
jgi:hypothetical protein